MRIEEPSLSRLVFRLLCLDLQAPSVLKLFLIGEASPLPSRHAVWAWGGGDSILYPMWLEYWM